MLEWLLQPCLSQKCIRKRVGDMSAHDVEIVVCISKFILYNKVDIGLGTAIRILITVCMFKLRNKDSLYKILRKKERGTKEE